MARAGEPNQLGSAKPRTNVQKPWSNRTQEILAMQRPLALGHRAAHRPPGLKPEGFDHLLVGVSEAETSQSTRRGF